MLFEHCLNVILPLLLPPGDTMPPTFTTFNHMSSDIHSHSHLLLIFDIFILFYKLKLLSIFFQLFISQYLKFHKLSIIFLYQNSEIIIIITINNLSFIVYIFKINNPYIYMGYLAVQQYYFLTDIYIYIYI